MVSIQKLEVGMTMSSFSEDVPLITKDSAFGAYGVRTIW